eukprot:TRINITY_DN17230_c0_g1_i1.p1 TRINITY_DN17230_c0_g1~~TRINITY_DN17230_c0_g1_i1.p1  ORF type:complete len:224 (-),score=46.08 TRINITY_DN17230_c0_g1_i1:29-700(-)
MNIDNLFEGEIIPLSYFEKLPKNIICIILCLLNTKDLTLMWRLNKFFFRLISNSNHSKLIWKYFCSKYDILQQGVIVNEEEIDEILKEDELTKYERKMDRYCKYFKYGMKMKWNKNKCGESIILSNNNLTCETGNHVKGSWNSVVGELKMSSSVHYVEVVTNKMGSTRFMYLGVADSNVKVDNVCNSSPHCWVAGNAFEFWGTFKSTLRTLVIQFFQHQTIKV